MELRGARQLLLDFGKGCNYRGMQMRGETKKKGSDVVCVQ